MSQHFEAFAHEPVVDNFARKICSLCLWNESVIAGLEDGSVLVLQENGPSSTAQPDTSAAWQVIQASKGLSRKPVTQLMVVKKRPLLLVLTDEGVNLYSLPEFSLKCQANRTRGASMFTWDEERSMLVVAIKRRLAMFTLQSSDLLDLKELNAQDQVTSVLCSGENLIVCTRRECSLISMTTGTVSEIFSSPKQFISSIVALPSGEVLVIRDNLGIFLSKEGKPSRHAPLTWSAAPISVVISPPYAIAALPEALEVRCISKLSNNSVFQSIPLPHMMAFSPLIGEDGQVFVASAGMEGIKCLKRTAWSSQCWALAEQGEFSVAMEILHLIPDSEQERCQMLEDMLRVLQGFELFSQGEFDEGMAQISLSSNPHPLILLCLYPSLVPRVFSHLLPTYIHGRELPKVKEPEGDDLQRAVALLLPYLLSLRTRLITAAKQSHLSTTKVGAAAVDSTPSTSKHDVVTTPSTSSYVSAAENGENSSGKKVVAAADPPEPSKEEICTVLDTVILKVQLVMPDTGALLHFVQQENFIELQEAEKDLLDTGRYAELVALYQQHHRHAEGLDLLYKLSQDVAALPVKPTGAAADLPGLPGVWAALRYLMGMRDAPEAPTLAKAHARWVLQQDPEAALEAYLQMKPPLEVDMVLAMLNAHAQDYKAVYLEAAVDMGIARPEKYHSELLLIYLQIALEEEGKTGGGRMAGLPRSLADLITNRPAQPLKLFPEEKPSGQPASISTPSSPRHKRQTSTMSDASTSSNMQAESEATPLELTNLTEKRQSLDAYQRLRELVYKSRHIDPNYVLGKLPQNSLPEIRALMFERLGRHRDALHLYCHSIQDMALAEAYCDRVYDALLARKKGTQRDHPLTPSEGSYLALLDRPGDMYMELIMALLKEGSTEVFGGSRSADPSPRSSDEVTDHALWQQIARLLSRKRDRINAQQMLELMPGNLSLEEVFPFFEGIVTHSSTTRRHLAVVKHLQRSENLLVREELVQLQQQSILLTKDRACCICHKRIGTSVFVAYPNDALAHYLCYKRQSLPRQGTLAASDLGLPSL